MAAPPPKLGSPLSMGSALILCTAAQNGGNVHFTAIPDATG